MPLILNIVIFFVLLLFVSSKICWLLYFATLGLKLNHLLYLVFILII